MVAHVSIPVFHTHSPYVARKDVRIQVRAGLLALLLALVVSLVAVVAWTVLPGAAADTKAHVVRWSTSTTSTSGMQFPRETPNYDFMYAPGAETRSVDHMYAKPRPRSFGR